MIERIGISHIAHVCVDGIIYLGNRPFGQLEADLGVFTQEFVGACMKIKGINVYCATDGEKCIKFKHGGYDLLYDKEIDETKNFTFEDLEHLTAKERVGDILWEEN